MARWSSSIHWNFIGAPIGSGGIASRPLRAPRRVMRLQTAATNVVRIAASRSQSHLYRGTCPDASLSIIGCARRVSLVGPVAFSRCWSKEDERKTARAMVPRPSTPSPAEFCSIGVSCRPSGSRLRTQAHARKPPQVLRLQLPTSALARELSERPMQGTSCCLNHFGVIEVADAQDDRNLKTGRSAIDLKRNANLLAPAGCFDPGHFDREFAHRLARLPGEGGRCLNAVPPARPAIHVYAGRKQEHWA